MSIGIPAATEPLRALVASQAPVRIDRLRDPNVPLEDLTALAPAAHATTAGDLIASRAL